MTHEKFEGERTLMRIHIGESDKWHGKSLHEAIVEMLRKEKFSGATVLRGVGGFGSSSVCDAKRRKSCRPPVGSCVARSADQSASASK